MAEAGQCGADDQHPTFVVELDGNGVRADAVGGKAAAIDRLVGAGFTVPAAAAITADAYRAFVEQDSIRRLLDELPDVDDVEDADAEAQRIADAFADAPMPDGVVEAIDDVVGGVAGRSGDPKTVAARSSATVEDAATASYAGQFTTELGREPGEDLHDAVRRVWASAWAPAVRSYRAAVGDEGELAMGVLLMDMVDARHAGVVFTRAPEDENRIRIETVEGLGEELVSGKVTPERKLLSRDDPGAELDDSDPGFLAELAETALAIERELGGEAQDIEWAHDGERLWIVQSRPITVEAGEAPPEHAQGGEAAPDDGFDTPLAGHAHTPAGVREMLPGVLPPLVWTMTAPRLEEAFRSLFAALGALPVQELQEGRRFIGRFRGRAALDLDLMRAAARMMVGQSEAELERQYFGEVLSSDLQERPEDDDAEGGLRGFAPLLRAIRLRGAKRHEAAIVNEATDLVLDARPDLGSIARDELVRYHHATLDLAARAISAEVAVAALAAAAYRALERYLERVVDERHAAELAQRLTAGAIPICKATALEVCDLVDTACKEPALARILTEADDDDVFDELRRVDGGDAFLEQFGAVIDRAGSAKVFGGERWAERPGTALSTVRQALRRTSGERPDPQERLDELEHRLTSTWRWRASRVFTGQVIDVRVRLLRRTVNDAIELLRLREETKRTVLRIGGETRRIVDHVAKELVHDDGLHHPGDIELLGHEEFLRVLDGDPPPDRDELDRRRQLLDRMEALGSLPMRFDERPGRAAAAETGDGNVLQGWGAGPGSHTGRPVVVTDQRSADLHEGDVLVATSTDPSWTPLFVTAGAVVVEEGGPLSHAAIVAREFGLPAVLNVPGAVDRLGAAGQVTVDGTAGTIEIVDDASAEDVPADDEAPTEDEADT